MAPFLREETHNFTIALENVLEEMNRINALRSKCSMNHKDSNKTPLIKTSEEFVYTYVVPNLWEKMHNNYSIKNDTEETYVWYSKVSMEYRIQLIFDAL